ncbi:DoxX family protein [Pseudonocardia acaciae]|uniref:DoxX family protein n=1 Tax=Pseudonocardia acaciae TaxID=551276 RepID=UPI000490B360|nr:DoxX family protein [Pseudonocardia acaciae]
MITPWWPLVALAVVQVGDAVMCAKPVAFIRQCLLDVHYPQRLWKLLPPLKVAAAAGLVAGIWFPPLAVLTCAALVAYFVIAVSAHVRVRDFGRNLFLNATGMLAGCTAVLVFVIQAA